jgi:hypothetical protein
MFSRKMNQATQTAGRDEWPRATLKPEKKERKIHGSNEIMESDEGEIGKRREVQDALRPIAGLAACPLLLHRHSIQL